MKASLDLHVVEIVEASCAIGAMKKKADVAVPGKPSFHLE